MSILDPSRMMNGTLTRLGNLGFQLGLRPLAFNCNICGEHCLAQRRELTRESPICTGCGSTPRNRAVIHVLSLGLFGRSIALPDFPILPEVHGIGLSDWSGYAALLSRKLTYTNTFYERQPRLDISRPDQALWHTLDFLISSDVFEHVMPPIELAFEGAHRLLKPGGFFVLTVPFSPKGDTVEYYPDLYDYTIEGNVLHNITDDGRHQRFENLRFHGGEGLTLEMRWFTEPSLIANLRAAGFRAIRIHRAYLRYGIWWPPSFGLPITARA